MGKAAMVSPAGVHAVSMLCLSFSPRTPAARAAPSALPRPFPQPDPSPQSPSSFTSLDRVLACKIAVDHLQDNCPSIAVYLFGTICWHDIFLIKRRQRK